MEALKDLEIRTVAADGGRLKLEWGELTARTGEQVEDLLWWEGDALIGFLGLYAFGPPIVELAGMVDPAVRRRGIATELLDAALPLCRQRGYRQALLVTPRDSAAGRGFALRHGAVLEHSEHALVLVHEPVSGPAYPDLVVRAATVPDVPIVSTLLTAGFGHAPGDVAARLSSATEQTLLVELAGVPVGTLRVTREGDVGGVYGFVVDPASQGRGIGRDVLRRACRQLREEGMRQIGLEVAVENDRALGLYTSLGFTKVTTEDYYALDVS